MAHKIKTQKYAVDKTCQNVSCLLLQLKFRLEKDRFSTQSSQYQTWKANKYSILTVTELGHPETSPNPLAIRSEHKSHKMRIKYWLPIGFNLGSS